MDTRGKGGITDIINADVGDDFVQYCSGSFVITPTNSFYHLMSRGWAVTWV